MKSYIKTILLVLACHADVSAQTMPASRNPLKWPFSERSIWNTPIGKNAIYVPAQMPFIPRGQIWAAMPNIDKDIIVQKPTAPLLQIGTSSAAWTGANRCTATSTQVILGSIPVPADFIVPDGDGNNSAAILGQDNRTIYQVQPFTRCEAGQPATALLAFFSVDLYGDGASGAHGGSKLSAIGGTIRMGELRPDGNPVRHVLKVEVDSPEVLSKCATPSDCFRWPALSADSGAPITYGSIGPSTIPPGMKMGALLAIPTFINLSTTGLETAPGKMLAWTLQNYGAYIVDTTGGAGFSIVAETGPDGDKTDEFQSDWGMPMKGWVATNNPWTRDIQRLAALLFLVDNNTAATPGGGGTPLQPLAPPILPNQGNP